MANQANGVGAFLRRAGDAVQQGADRIRENVEREADRLRQAIGPRLPQANNQAAAPPPALDGRDIQVIPPDPAAQLPEEAHAQPVPVMGQPHAGAHVLVQPAVPPQLPPRAHRPLGQQQLPAPAAPLPANDRPAAAIPDAQPLQPVEANVDQPLGPQIEQAQAAPMPANDPPVAVIAQPVEANVDQPLRPQIEQAQAAPMPANDQPAAGNPDAHPPPQVGANVRRPLRQRLGQVVRNGREQARELFVRLRPGANRPGVQPLVHPPVEGQPADGQEDIEPDADVAAEQPQGNAAGHARPQQPGGWQRFANFLGIGHQDDPQGGPQLGLREMIGVAADLRDIVADLRENPDQLAMHVREIGQRVLNFQPPAELQQLLNSLRRVMDGEVLDEAAMRAVLAELTELLNSVRDRPPLPAQFANPEEREAFRLQRERFFAEHAPLFYALRDRHYVRLSLDRTEDGFIKMARLLIEPNYAAAPDERAELGLRVRDVYSFIDCVIFSKTGLIPGAIQQVPGVIQQVQGVANNVVDHAMDGGRNLIREGVNQAVGAPRRIIEDFVLGSQHPPQPAQPAPVAPQPNAPQPAPAEGQPPANPAAPGLPDNWNLGDLVNHFGRWVRDGVQRNASELVINTFLLALEQAQEQAQNDQATHAQIGAVIEQMRNARRDNQLPTVMEIIRRISNGQAIIGNVEAGNRILQFVFMGFRLPIMQGMNVAPVDEGFRRIMREVPQPAQERINYQAELPKAKNRLVDNIGALATMERINRWFCSGLITQAEMPNILSAAHRGVFKDEVQKIFFAKIETLEISRVRKWMAKFFYVTIRFFSESFLKRLSDGFLKKMEVFIQAQQANGGAAPIRNIQNSSINNMNNYLTILHDRITRIHENPAYARPEVMIEKALSDPKANEGYTKAKLYRTAIGKAVDDFFPPIGWKARFENWNSTQNSVLKFFLNVFVGLPIRFAEWISGAFTRTILKTFLMGSKAFDKMIDLSIQQVRDRNGYTHAINKLTIAMLDKIYRSLQAPAGNIPEPIANREALTQMIVNFHNVLLLNAQAGRIGADPALFERLRTGLFIAAANQSVDVLAMLAGAAYKAVMQPDQLYKLSYEGLTTISKALEGAQATEQEMLDTEREVELWSDLVLNKAVEIEIHRQINPAIPQNRIAAKLDAVKQETRNFLANIRPLIQQNGDTAGALRQYLIALQNEADRDADLRRDFREHYGQPLELKLNEIRSALFPRQNEVPGNVETKLTELEQLVDGFPLNPPINIGIPQGVQRMIQAAAFNLGKGLIKEIWKAARTPYNWRGFLHHCMLIPYVKGRFSQ